MTVCSAVMLPILVGLGWWQLERAELKRDNALEFVARMSALPITPPGSFEDVSYMRVRLDGAFEGERYFLVDNQLDAGRPGYWVLAGFRAEDGRRWLVNRGWIAAPVQRNVLPEVPVPVGRLLTIGTFWPDTGLVPLLDEDLWEGPWPIRVQRLNVARMSRRLENTTPREIRLEPFQPGSLGALSIRTSFDSERHVGYAVQWFGLSIVLVVGYTIFGFKR